MIVAVMYGNNVSINEYPELQDIEKIRNDFLPDALLIELTEKPEEKDGYKLKYNGSEFYYEKIVNPEPEPDVWAEMAQAIAEGVNDIE